MKRRGFLQAVFGAAAVPAAIKAAEAFDQVPDLPVAKPVAKPEPMPQMAHYYCSYTSACTATMATSYRLAHDRCKYCGRLNDYRGGSCLTCGAPL